MRYSLFIVVTWAILGGIATSPVIQADDDVTTIRKLHEAAHERFQADLRAANHNQDKVSKANVSYRRTRRDLVELLKEVIKQHPESGDAFRGIELLVGPLEGSLDEELTNIVLDHHLANPAMGQLCFRIRGRGLEKWVTRILEATAERHPEKDARGLAVFALAEAQLFQANAQRSQTPGVYERDELFSLAKARYETAASNFGTLLTPGGKTTLGERATLQLARISNIPNLKVGRPAPPIKGRDLAGNQLCLEDFRGKVVVLVFWGSWCAPCMKMVPLERELQQRHAEKQFALIGVNCGETLERAKATVEERQMEWPHWWDGDEIWGPIETHYNIQHFPTVFVINADGLITAIDVHDAALEQAVGDALNEVQK